MADAGVFDEMATGWQWSPAAGPMPGANIGLSNWVARSRHADRQRRLIAARRAAAMTTIASHMGRCAPLGLPSLEKERTGGDIDNAKPGMVGSTPGFLSDWS